MTSTPDLLLIFLALLFAHALGDFPLQGWFMAEGKNFRRGIPGVNWQFPMFYHCLIQAGLVAFVTGSLLLGTVEFMVHTLTDVMKCDEDITFAQDQMIHIGFKAVWALLAFYGHYTPFSFGSL